MLRVMMLRRECRSRRWRLLAVRMLMLSVLGCAPQWKAVPHDALDQIVEEVAIEKPPQRGLPSDWWEAGLLTGVRPLGQALSPDTYVDKVTGGREALDVNDFGEVYASSWFEPRIVLGDFGPEDTYRGSVRHDPPAPGLLTVISGKTEGTTPGFVVRDSDGVVWYVKFDPPGFPSLTTAAEIVASRAIHAAGYNVPETHLLDLDLRRVDLASDAKTPDEYNSWVPFDEKRLTEFFILLNPDRSGQVRAIFSRQIEGEPLGMFSYRGVDAGDPNDLIPHERRRSLRGLWVLFAWLNNTDTKSSNTLDTFVRTEGERGVVKHYLLDLGDSLGAAGDRAKYRHEGYEPYFDWAESGKRLVSLGLRYPYWLALAPMRSRTMGSFEARVFDPDRWSPQFPNPAFDEADPRDTFWGASILARFEREHVVAIVDAARYDDPVIREAVIDTLMERRKKLLAYAFDGFTAIDRPSIAKKTLSFVNLNRLYQSSYESVLNYVVRWNRTARRDVVVDRGSVMDSSVDLKQALETARGYDDFAKDPFLTVSIQSASNGPTELHLRDLGDRILVVGLERKRESTGALKAR